MFKFEQFDVIVIREKTKYVLMDDRFLSKEGWISPINFKETMDGPHKQDVFDIIEVYRIKKPYNSIPRNLINTGCMEKVWEREKTFHIGPLKIIIVDEEATFLTPFASASLKKEDVESLFVAMGGKVDKSQIRLTV